MIRSMTGYGKASREISNFVLEIEIKSLNNRFLEIVTRIPKEFSAKEYEIRNLIRNNIQRGKISFSMNIAYLNTEDNSSNLNDKAVEKAIELLNRIKNLTRNDEKITLNHILQLQNLFIEENGDADENLFKQVEETILSAVNCMNLMREKEGSELISDLNERISIIENKVIEIENLLKSQVTSYFERLKERTNQLIADFSQFDDRLNLELALLSEKYDTSEEIVRLKSHIKQFREIISKEQEVGKRLNFLLQEMNREANTINSKSISTEISYSGLTIKEELEKIREQVQNIE